MPRRGSFHRATKIIEPAQRRDRASECSGRDLLLHALNYALKEDSPDYAIIALCNYAASIIK